MKRLVLLAFMLVSLVLMQGCGIPAESGGTSGASNDDVGSGPGTTPVGQVARYKGLIINVERLNGSTVLNGNVSFVALASNGVESRFDLPKYVIEYSEETDNVLLKITETDYIEHINHVIKISFGSGENYYAPLPANLFAVESDSRVTLQTTASIFSHYVVKRLIEKITNEEQLAELQPCDQGGPLVNCLNQPRAKQNLFMNISAMASEYNIDFARNTTVSDALNQLRSDTGFSQQVEAGLDEILRKDTVELDSGNQIDINAPIARGTYRQAIIPGNEELITFNVPISQVYNSVYFDLTLNADNADDQTEIIASTSRLDSDSPFGYPTYSKTTEMSHLRFENSLSTNLPLEQQALNVSGLNPQTSTLSVDRKITDYKIDTAFTSDSHITTQGHVLDARVFNQEILPGDSSTREGREYTPMYSRLYKANEYEPPSTISASDLSEDDEESIDYGNEPTWLTTSGYKEITDVLISNFDGSNQSSVDTHKGSVFSWEVHGLQTEPDFTLDSTSGKDYGVVTFGIKLNETDKVLEVIGELSQWSGNGSAFDVSQPSSADNFYRTYRLSLNQNGSVNTLSNDRNQLYNRRLINTVQTLIDDTDHSGGTTAYDYGLVALDDGTERPLGHSTYDGSYLAFGSNTTAVEAVEDRGVGMTLASELKASQGATLKNTSYQLQGNTISIEDGKNTFRNLNGSTLSFADSNTCTATLSLDMVEVVQSIDENSSELSGATFKSNNALVVNGLNATQITNATGSSISSYTSSACTQNANEITMTFTTDLAQPLTLKGFLSNSDDDAESGNLMTLLWLQDNTAGLVFAHKNQELCAYFDDQVIGDTWCAIE